MSTPTPEPSADGLSGPWPLVGRAEVLVAAVDALVGTTAHAVVLGGPAGVGRSRLVAEVLSRVRERELVVERVVATRSASTIAFGALAPLLPVDELLADSVVGLLQRAASSLAGRGAGRRIALAVDDAHLLDDASATLLNQLALDGHVRLLLAVRHGEHLSAPLAGVVSHPATVRIHVPELSRASVDRLAHLLLGGTVDGPVTQALFDGSQGNALYLRELLIAAVADGTVAVDHGVWRLVGRPAVPPRLMELIGARLATTSPEERRALELLAVDHGIGRLALEDLVGTAVVSRLVERGLVVAGRDGRRQPVRLHHPLYEEALLHAMSSRRARAVQRACADGLTATGLRRRGDRLAVTTLRLTAGDDVDLAALEAAALDAYFAMDIAAAEQLAAAGVAAGAGPRLRRVLAEVVRWQGRHEEAEVLLATTSLDGAGDEVIALTALARAENAFRGLGDRTAAEDILERALALVTEEAWRQELTALGAVVAAMAGDVREALAIATPIIEQGASRAMAIASTAAVAALTFAGRADDAAAAAEAAFLAASTLAPVEGQSVAATHVMERCLGLIEAGRLDEGEMIARLSYEWALVGHHAIGQGWFSLLLARTAQVRGRLDEASTRFRESALVWRDLRDDGLRRWALAGLAQTMAAAGRGREAAAVLVELDTTGATATNLLEVEVLRGRAWTSIARGATAEGRAHLLAAVAWAAERGQHGLELAALHDLVRIGEVRVAGARAAALAPQVQGPLAAAWGRHAAAAVQRDGAALDEAAAAFEAIGADLLAAEAAANAAAHHDRVGRRSSATASATRSAALAERCRGARTPALGGGQRLTARELELSRLAAAGRTSADIAEELGISVRTVNNLLQRAYSKLGVSGRRELPDRLATL